MTTERVPASTTLQEYEGLRKGLRDAATAFGWTSRGSIKPDQSRVHAASRELDSWASRVVEERDALRARVDQALSEFATDGQRERWANEIRDRIGIPRAATGG
jgi:hypothetical protein